MYFTTSFRLPGLDVLCRFVVNVHDFHMQEGITSIQYTCINYCIYIIFNQLGRKM